MPKKRKEGNDTTTISIKWGDKDKLRKLARPIKKTKNGTKYETDMNVFNRVINDYLKSHPSEVGDVNTTYPIIPQDKPQQGSSHEGPTPQ
jgi:hypothetical protein